LGLTDNPTCERCLEEYESATHVLCDCEATVHLRFRHLGQPSDFYDALISEVLHFIRSMGLTKGCSKGKHNRSVMVAVQRAGRGPSLIHTYPPPRKKNLACITWFPSLIPNRSWMLNFLPKLMWMNPFL
jgi:hypothetical protein